LNRVLGCVIGSFVGNAAGGPLEFHFGEITVDSVEKAMQLEGNEFIGLGPG
jgi:hypothetical protein